jgi:hypothetical protein
MRPRRLGLVLLIVLAYLAAPLAADACAWSCAGAAPACHHGRSTSQHISHAPDFCRYEHDALRAAPPSVGLSSVDSSIATLAALWPEDTQPFRHPDPHGSGDPPLVSSIRASLAPLRI